MEIRVLRYFLAIAREESITGAAARLHITQPTLSRQIKDLEDQLGQKLFLREKHRMTLTAEGMLLRKRAEEILDLVDKTEAEFSAMEESVSGSIYIGSGETDAMRLIADVIRDLQETFPSIHFHLYSGNAEDVTEKLDKGLLDFGILIEPADLSKYNFIRLPRQRHLGCSHEKRQSSGAKRADPQRRPAKPSADLLQTGHYKRSERTIPSPNGSVKISES